MPEEAAPARFSDALRSLIPTLREFGPFEALTLVVLTVPFWDGLATLIENDFKGIDAWMTFLAFSLGSAAASLTFIIQKRNVLYFAAGATQGSAQMLAMWDASAGHLESSLNSTARYFSRRVNTKDRSVTAAEEAVDRLLRAIEHIFSGLFSETCGTLHVSLGIPNATETQLKIVKMYPERAGRAAENEYPIDLNPETAQTMSLAFMQPEAKQTVYTPITEGIPELEGKPYLTVLNITVYGPRHAPARLFPQQPWNNNARGPIGVVNIDSTNADAFSDSDRLALAYRLSMPHLRTLALLLSDKRVFGEYRFVGSEA